MSKTLAYLRTSTDKQDLSNQRLEILEYAHQNALYIDDFVEISISSRKHRRARRTFYVRRSIRSDRKVAARKRGSRDSCLERWNISRNSRGTFASVEPRGIGITSGI